MTNRFIHHPTIQNDRQRGGDSAVGVVAAAAAVAGGTGGTGGAAAAANVHDKEQFPSLSSVAASSSVAPVATKLNFKEMVLKNAAGAGAAGATETSSSASASAITSTSTSAVVRDAPKVRTEYSRAPLSSGNIFLGAFYGSRNDGDGGDGDGGDGWDGVDGDLGGGGGGSFISSTLIDSCDRKYDNLYR
jgi:hypothetical protein